MRPGVFFAARFGDAHSRKPAEAYRRIERYAAGPHLELFACEQLGQRDNEVHMMEEAMAPRRHSRITTATALKRREVAARAIQAAVGPASEIARLQAQVEELLATARQREFVIEALRRRLEGLEDESGRSRLNRRPRRPAHDRGGGSLNQPTNQPTNQPKQEYSYGR
jgi:hypothetical protein